MSNFVVPGPNGGIPSIQYIEHLRDAGILTTQIANQQINYIKLYNVVEEGLNYDLTGKTGPKRGSMKGVPKISPEGKKIKSEKMKKLWAEGKVKGRNSKPFIDVSTNIRYNNITECVTSLKISSGTFYKRLKKGEFKYI